MSRRLLQNTVSLKDESHLIATEAEAIVHGLSSALDAIDDTAQNATRSMMSAFDQIAHVTGLAKLIASTRLDPEAIDQQLHKITEATYAARTATESIVIDDLLAPYARPYIFHLVDPLHAVGLELEATLHHHDVELMPEDTPYHVYTDSYKINELRYLADYIFDPMLFTPPNQQQTGGQQYMIADAIVGFDSALAPLLVNVDLLTTAINEFVDKSTKAIKAHIAIIHHRRYMQSLLKDITNMPRSSAYSKRTLLDAWVIVNEAHDNVSWDIIATILCKSMISDALDAIGSTDNLIDVNRCNESTQLAFLFLDDLLQAHAHAAATST